VRASAAQSAAPADVPPAPDAALAIVTALASPGCATGTPAAAGAATSAGTPATTSKSTAASWSACASSLPRPKRNGSPW
jgi:hypothetical protein